MEPGSRITVFSACRGWKELTLPLRVSIIMVKVLRRIYALENRRRTGNEAFGAKHEKKPFVSPCGGYDIYDDAADGDDGGSF